MATGDKLAQAVRAVHAAGLDTRLWPGTLQTLCGLFDAAAASLEVTDKRTMRLVRFHDHGLPPATEIAYASEYLKRSPRVRYGLSQRAGEIGFDYLHIDETGMDADAFYSKLLPTAGVRYYISSVIVNDAGEFTVLAVHRPARAGHVGEAEIDLMRRLTPHLQQAHDVGRRLGNGPGDVSIFEGVLNWLADGVVVIAADGSVRFANRAARLIAARDDGIRLSSTRVEFQAPQARARYEMALQSVRALLADGTETPAIMDFAVARPDGTPGYLVSVRPITPGEDSAWSALDAMAIVFIRDPLASPAGRIAQSARELFGLTETEASLADALCAGMSPQRYARERLVSLNTVYTHLRRIKAKTGSARMPDLIGRLAALNPTWRN